MSDRPGTASHDHIGALDGLRGLAALWVFFSHVQILTGMRRLPVLSWGGLAVDLFMMISGFLMAWHYIGRARQEPWERPRTCLAFWLRRFFRIAPAYYLLLAIALLLGPTIGADRATIGAAWPWTQTPSGRFFDVDLAKIAAHVTFVFGALPTQAFSTPLPDWSIGLEMQFYLVMPLLMLALGKRFAFGRALAVLAFSLVLAFALRGYSAAFEMPSFLPMKLGVFLAGMFCAYGVANKDMRGPLVLVALVVAARLAISRQGEDVGFAVVAFAFALLVGASHLPGGGVARPVLAPVQRALSSKAGILAGELAFSVYLVHLLVLTRVAAWLLGLDAYRHIEKSSLRFLVAGGISLAVTLAIALVVYRLVERPGIALGKRIVTRLRGGAAPLGMAIDPSI